jgi:hypothetical protein
MRVQSAHAGYSDASWGTMDEANSGLSYQARSLHELSRRSRQRDDEAVPAVGMIVGPRWRNVLAKATDQGFRTSRDTISN